MKEKLVVGFAVTGSFCTFKGVKEAIKKLVELDMKIIPIFSDSAQNIDCRFGNAKEHIREIEEITGENAVLTIARAEPVGPKNLLDLLLIAPCTGNTMAKLCAGITDSPVLMAAKAHLRNEKPVIISISTNDALGMNFKNLGALINIRNIYFVPFGQDDFLKKPNSMISHIDLIPETIEAALRGKQLQPLIRSPF